MRTRRRVDRFSSLKAWDLGRFDDPGGFVSETRKYRQFTPDQKGPVKTLADSEALAVQARASLHLQQPSYDRFTPYE